MKNKKIFLGLCMLLLLSISVFGLDIKPDKEKFESDGDLKVVWEHTLNSLDRQEFLFKITSTKDKTIKPSLILSEYTKSYSDISINDIKVYLEQNIVSYEYPTLWCTDYTYTDCSIYKNGSYSISSGYEEVEVITKQYSEMVKDISQIKEKDIYFEFDLNDIVLEANKEKVYKIVFEKTLDIGDYGVFSININNKEFWDKTHSSDFLITNQDLYYKFDGNTLDETSNNIDATNNGATLTTGIINQAYSYDGNDYMTFDSSIIYNDLAGSVQVWVYPTSLSGTQRVFSYGGDNTNTISIDIREDAGNFYFAFTGITAGGSSVFLGNTSISNNNWYHVVFVSSGTTWGLYVNGVLQSLTSIVGVNNGNWFGDTTKSNHKFYIGVLEYNNLFENYFTGIIDEVGVWNSLIDQNNVSFLYNEGSPTSAQQYPFSSDAPINITFKSQTPNDLDFSNILEGVNITYTILNPNTSEDIYLNFTLENGSILINDTFLEYPSFQNYFSVLANDYKFLLDKTQIVPSNYHINPDYIYNNNGSVYNLDSSNDRLKLQFNGFKNDTEYNIFELDLISELDQNLPVFYCNSTYVDGLITVSNLPLGCSILGQIETTAEYNHTHGLYSGTQTVDFTIIDGEIGGVVVTNTSYIITRGVSGNSMDVRYVTNNTYKASISGNGGLSYTDFVGTFDTHLHQYTGNETLVYSACGYDNNGTLVCNDEQFDSYGDLPSFEELPFVRITNPPADSSYYTNDDLIITWVGFDGDGDSLDYSLTVNDVLILNKVNNTSYNIDLSAYLGEVSIDVEVCEVGSFTRCTSDSYSFNVLSSTEAVTGFNFNFSWDIPNPQPVIFGCPTNAMQFVIIICFVAFAIMLYVVGYILGQPIIMLVGSLVWIMSSTFLFGCSELIGWTLIITGLMSAIYSLTVKIMK